MIKANLFEPLEKMFELKSFSFHQSKKLFRATRESADKHLFYQSAISSRISVFHPQTLPSVKAEKENLSFPLIYFSFAAYRKCDLSLDRVAETEREKVKKKICCLFQIDQNAAEDFNLTSDGEFNAIKSLVLGKVHGKETGSGLLNQHPHGANRCGSSRTLLDSTLLSESRTYLPRLCSC